MKTNFEIKKNKENDADKNHDSVIVDKKEDLTEAEFEEFIGRSGAGWFLYDFQIREERR